MCRSAIRYSIIGWVCGKGFENGRLGSAKAMLGAADDSYNITALLCNIP